MAMLKNVSSHLPAGQLKSFENSFILLKGPKTLNGLGGWLKAIKKTFNVAGR